MRLAVTKQDMVANGDSIENQCIRLQLSALCSSQWQFARLSHSPLTMMLEIRV